MVCLSVCSKVEGRDYDLLLHCIWCICISVECGVFICLQFSDDCDFLCCVVLCCVVCSYLCRVCVSVCL